MGFHRTRKRRRRRHKGNRIDRRLEIETVVSVARDLAAARERESILTEQARLKSETMARMNRP